MKGDRITMNFEVIFQNNEFGGLGMAHGMAYHGVVSNGTFINESFFPRIGYRSGWEIESNAIREKHGLPSKDRMMSWNDPNASLANSRIFSKMNFDFVVSTSKEQTVVAPGKLVANWKENSRNYFKFESITPVESQFVILSGNYEMLTDEFRSNRQKEAVELKVYHDQGHSINVPSMMKSLKASLKYCEANFSSFQYDQLQIVEFPRYSRFAQSVPNTIPFSEDIGFNMDIKEGDADVPYYVTAHEVSHQWWGDQLQGSWVQGVAMLSETLAQYSAAMIYRKEFGMESLEQIIDYERNRYLKGRATEGNGEKVLIEVESQAYIHYGKGLTNMLALEAYIGEVKINAALSSFLNEWSVNKKEGKYPLTEDLMNHFRAVTPDSLQFLVSDLFEKIVLNDIRLQSAEWTQTEPKTGILSLKISATKTCYSDIGEELEVEEIKWIPVGIYDNGLIRYELMPIDSNGTIQVRLDDKPQKVELDPYHFMIERNRKDNSFEF
jgi:aminopeptidase N